MAAAVADYRPAKPAAHKLKRGTLGAKTTLDLVANPDLLAELGVARGKKKRPVLVGFAAETRDVVANARRQAREQAVRSRSSRTTSPSPAPGSPSTPTASRSSTPPARRRLPAAPKSTVAHRILDRVALMLRSKA